MQRSTILSPADVFVDSEFGESQHSTVPHSECELLVMVVEPIGCDAELRCCLLHIQESVLFVRPTRFDSGSSQVEVMAVEEIECSNSLSSEKSCCVRIEHPDLIR